MNAMLKNIRPSKSYEAWILVQVIHSIQTGSLDHREPTFTSQPHPQKNRYLRQSFRTDFGPERDMMRVIAWSWNTDATGASSIRVAQLIRQGLQFVRREARLIEEYVVMSRFACALEHSIVGYGTRVIMNAEDLTWIP